MLTVTEEAAEAIAGLSARLGGDGEGGLRVATVVESPGKLVVSAAAAPMAGDRVLVASERAQVFLDPQAAERLSDKVLDVRKGTDGEIEFVLTGQS